VESKRQSQVAELVKRHFSLLLQSEGVYIYGASVLVTVTGVKMSPDLLLAKIYLSIFNTENKQEVMLMLEDQHQRLRTAFAKRIKQLVRRIPEIQFYEDDMLDEIIKVDALFNRLESEDQLGRNRSEEE